MSYVREVIENLIPAMELPGGVYNFGSECDGDMSRQHDASPIYCRWM